MKEGVKNTGKLFGIFAWLIMLSGIVVRIAVYLQNRNFFIDEANVARNVYERGFAGLAKPLSYEQYAPPVFMWLLKLSGVLFGYGEYALRLYPIIAGVASVIALFYVLKELMPGRALWYPLLLFCVGFIFIKYSSELKQYVSDALVTLLLILLALKTDIFQKRQVQFILLWCIVGSIAIWLSMPSVFTLAGIGLYYMCICLQRKDYKRLLPVILTGGVWIAQFAFYYIVILKPQANTDYLQNFHREYFLILIPKGYEEMRHNWGVIKELINEASGYGKVNIITNGLLIVVGLVFFMRRSFAKSLLIIVPLATTMLAAGLHQYSLIPRVAIFMMPLLLILIGYGLEQVMSIRFVMPKVLVAGVALYCAYIFSSLNMLYKPHLFEQVTDEFSFLQKHGIKGSELYVHWGTKPAYIYYTEINPRRQQWQDLDNAHLVEWYTNWDSTVQSIHGRAAFIYTSLSLEDARNYNTQVKKYMALTDSLEIEDGRRYAYIYRSLSDSTKSNGLQ